MTIMQGARMAAHEISASLRRYWPCQVQWDSLNSFASICKGVERKGSTPLLPRGGLPSCPDGPPAACHTPAPAKELREKAPTPLLPRGGLPSCPDGPLAACQAPAPAKELREYRYLREYPRNIISKMPLPDGSESGCKYNQF